MKKLNLIYIGIVWFLAAKAWAGNLTVDGDLTVNSNVTAQSISTGGDVTLNGNLNLSNSATRVINVDGGTMTIGRYNPADVGQGTAFHRTSDAYLAAELGWGNKAGLQAYANSSASNAELALNPNGGPVSVGTVGNTNGFYVAPNAIFAGNLTVNGKFHVSGSSDPPCVVLDAETRNSIVQRVSREVPPDKQTGAVLFFNQSTKRLEIYLPSEESFYDLAGNIIATQSLPATTSSFGRQIWFDAATGDVVTNQTVDQRQYQIREGYHFNSSDGQFYKLVSGVGSNNVAVPKSEAVEAIPVSP